MVFEAAHAAMEREPNQLPGDRVSSSVQALINWVTSRLASYAPQYMHLSYEEVVFALHVLHY